MVLVNLYGQVEIITKENLKMMKDTAKEKCSGLMVVFMMENGNEGYSMEWGK
jgi:hypothetical protein